MAKRGKADCEAIEKATAAVSHAVGEEEKEAHQARRKEKVSLPRPGKRGEAEGPTKRKGKLPRRRKGETRKAGR